MTVCGLFEWKQIWASPKPGPGFPTSYVMMSCFFVFSEFS